MKRIENGGKSRNIYRPDNQWDEVVRTITSIRRGWSKQERLLRALRARIRQQQLVASVLPSIGSPQNSLSYHGSQK